MYDAALWLDITGVEALSRQLLPANERREEAPDKCSKDCAAGGLQEATRHEAERPDHLRPHLKVEVALHMACNHRGDFSRSAQLPTHE